MAQAGAHLPGLRTRSTANWPSPCSASTRCTINPCPNSSGTGVFACSVFQRLHRGEENNLPNGVGVGQHHHAAVNADAQAARRRQAVLQSGDKVVVHHAGFVVALVPQLHLLLKALALVDGIVELGEGVAHLTVTDEQLKPLGERLARGDTSTGCMVMKVG